MKKKIIFLIIVAVGLGLILKMQIDNDKKVQKEIEKTMSEIAIFPISHASFILASHGFSIYVDPVDEGNSFEGKSAPDIILITDIHGDHFDPETLSKISTAATRIITSQAVAEKIPEELKSKVLVINNGDTINELDFKIEAIPMYNLPGPNENYHTKGRGNGYIIEIPARAGVEKQRVYISGDTAGIPEMRALQNIDIAFVAMNLPYTMGIDEAVDSVLEFKPKIVYPYHYRQNPTKDFADVARFKETINVKNPEIKVVQEDWYPKN